MYCSKCGSEIEENVQFCPKCGTKLEKDQNLLSEPKSNLIEEQGKENSSEKEIIINTTYYLKRYARNIITKFYVNGNNIRCEQDDSLFKKEPKSIYQFSLDDVLTCERKWFMYTNWFIKLRLIAAILVLILGLVFPPLLAFGLLLLFVNFIWIFKRVFRITLKNGEKINVYCNIYSQIEEIESILNKRNK